MTTLHTTREVGETIQKALPGFETEKWWAWWITTEVTKETDKPARIICGHDKIGVGSKYLGNEQYTIAPTLHETLIAIRELGKVRGWQKKYCKSGCECNPIDTYDINNGNHPGAACVRGYDDTKSVKALHTFIDTLIAADLDLSHPSVSEYLIKIFSEK